MESDWVEFSATLATDKPVEVYGGVRIPRDELERFAARINSAGLPWHREHDLTKPVRTRGLVAEVVQQEDGSFHLVATGEMVRSDWDGSLPGISMTTMTPIRDEVAAGDGLTVAADAAWFSDEAILEAADAAGASVPVRPERAYQFGAVSDPQVFFEVSLFLAQTLGPNLVASAMWDAIKCFFRARRTPPGGDEATPSSFNLVLEDGPSRRWTSTVQSVDSSLVKYAIDKLPEQAQSALTALAQGENPDSILFDEDSREWKPLGNGERPPPEGVEPPLDEA